jgi:hypothetical protein
MFHQFSQSCNCCLPAK